MKLADRIAEARGLCTDIDKDLQQVEVYRGARNPQASAAALSNVFYSLLNELREHVTFMLDHYERECAKDAKKAGQP